VIYPVYGAVDAAVDRAVSRALREINHD
jgi:hypothetical protein